MRRLCAALLFVVLLSVNRSPMLACWCSDGANWTNPEEAQKFLVKEFEDAITVFSGEVITADTSRVRIKVEKIWKGDFKEEITLSTGARKIAASRGSGEDLISVSTCDYRFEIGKKYLVFAKINEGKMLARRCGGTDLLEDSGRTIAYIGEIQTPRNSDRGKRNE